MLLVVVLLLGSSSLLSVATFTEQQSFSQDYAVSSTPNHRHVEQTKGFDTFVNASGALVVYFSAWDDLTVFGRFTSGSTIDYDILVNHSSTGWIDGALSSARFNEPKGIAIDPSIKDRPVIYAAEEGNFGIRRIDVYAGNVTTFTGNTASDTPVDGPVSVARFGRPFTLQFDNYGGSFTLYVSEKNDHGIRTIDMHTKIVTSLVPASLTTGAIDGDLASARFSQLISNIRLWRFGSQKMLYLTDTQNDRVRAINLQNNQVTTLIGGNSGAGDGIGTNGYFDRPKTLDIFNTSTGNTFMLVGGTGNSGRFLKVVNISGSGVQGRSLNIIGRTFQRNIDYDGPGTTATFANVQAILSDPRDPYRIYVGAKWTSNIRIVTYPTSSPTQAPSITPTTSPSTSPSLTPSSAPSSSPSSTPSFAPTSSPSFAPSSSPSAGPSLAPSLAPSFSPSLSPVSSAPSLGPSSTPSSAPSASPIVITSSPTLTGATSSPSMGPSSAPSSAPSSSPSSLPSQSPSVTPSTTPSSSPSSAPSASPTSSPSSTPSNSPTLSPTTISPATASPTSTPSSSPSSAPSSSPTSLPSTSPIPITSSPTINGATLSPSSSPSSSPSLSPSSSPSSTPSSAPSSTPSFSTTPSPSGSPSSAPSTSPTASPSVSTGTVSPSSSPSSSPTFSPSSAAPSSLQDNFIPTISLSGAGIVSPGQDIVLTAAMNYHLQSKNNSLSMEDVASFSYLWAISRIANNATGRPGTAIDLSQTPSSVTTVLTIPTQMLDPAERYQVIFEANMTKVYGPQRGLVSLTGILETSVRPLVAMIKGFGDFQEIPASSMDLYLDAGSVSYDPEEAKNATKTFEWSCTNHTTQQPCAPSQILGNGEVFSIPSQALRYSPDFPCILNITVNFSVVSNEGTLRRSSSRSLLVRVISESSPALFISGKSLILSRNGLIALTANRISSTNAGSESGSGTYRWLISDPSSSSRPSLQSFHSVSPHRSPLSLLSSPSGAGSTLGTTASLVIPLSQIAAVQQQPQQNKFTVYVERESENLLASVIIEVVDAPNLTSIQVQPLSGTAYTTTFEATASVSISDPIAAPVLTSFSYFPSSTSQSDSLVLCPYSSARDCKFTLPPGDHMILIGARDVLGGVSSRQFGPVRVLAQQYPSFASQSSECLKASQAVFLLRQMAEEAYPAFHVEYHRYGLRNDLCRSLNSTLSNLWDLGDVTNMLGLSRLALGVIEEIPKKGGGGEDIPLSECPDYAGALATTPTTNTAISGCSTDATLQSLSSGLRQIVSSYVARAASVPSIAQGEISLLVAEALDDAIDDVESNEEAETILDALETITIYAKPESLASELGHALADGYSSIFLKTSSFSESTAVSSKAAVLAATTTTSASSCALLNQTIDSIDLLLRRAGPTSPPQSNTGGVQYTTPAFDATTGSIFADEAGGLNATSSFRVSVDPTASASTTASLSSPGGYERAQSVLTLLRFDTATVSSCREQSRQIVQDQYAAGGAAGDGFVFASPDVASVNLYNASGARMLASGATHSVEGAISSNVTIVLTSVQEQCETSKLCRYWDTILQAWSGEGCAYNGTGADGTHLCVCNHLTEFTLLADQASCTEEENDVEAGYWALIGVFLAIAAAALVQIVRMGAGGFKSVHCVLTHLLIAIYAVLRIVSVLMVARLVDGFEHARMHFGISLGIIALPYYIGFTLYCLIIFQWVSVIHNARLSKNPFEQFQRRFIMTSAFLGVSVVAAGLAFFLLDLPPYAITGVIVGISLLLMVAYLVYGMLLAAKVSGKANPTKAATAHRFRRLVFCVTVPMFLSCCCSIAMQAGHEIYVFFLAALFCDAAALAVVVYMLKGKVRTAANGGSESSSTSRRRRGRTHRSRTGHASSQHSRYGSHHSRMGAAGKSGQGGNHHRNVATSASLLGAVSMQMAPLNNTSVISKLQMTQLNSTENRVIHGLEVKTSAQKMSAKLPDLEGIPEEKDGSELANSRPDSAYAVRVGSSIGRPESNNLSTRGGPSIGRPDSSFSARAGSSVITGSPRDSNRPSSMAYRGSTPTNNAGVGFLSHTVIPEKVVDGVGFGNRPLTGDSGAHSANSLEVSGRTCDELSQNGNSETESRSQVDLRI